MEQCNVSGCPNYQMPKRRNGFTRLDPIEKDCCRSAMIGWQSFLYCFENYSEKLQPNLL